MDNSTWTLYDSILLKKFRFDDFVAAAAFIAKVAKVAETMNHHPDISLYSCNNVEITTTTRAMNMVTSIDVRLAEMIDGIK